MDVLDWLAQWFQSQCDDDWEHGSGITTESIDNPGWSIKVALAGTDCDGRTLERTNCNYEHATDWWTCWTADNVLTGAADLSSFAQCLRHFGRGQQALPSQP